MKRWEYSRENCGAVLPEQTVAFLNQRGAEGWEAVGFDWPWVVFKREAVGDEFQSHAVGPGCCPGKA